MAHNFFINIKKMLFENILNFFKEHKICFLIVLILTILGIVLGIYNGIAVKEDLELENMTDVAMWGVLDDEWEFFTFFFNRLIFMLLICLICLFAKHILFVPILVYIIISRAYFFAFNFAVLIFNIKLVGMFYIICVSLPCYLLYSFFLVPIITFAICNSLKFRKYGYCNERGMFKRQIYSFIIFTIISYAIIALYETVFLFVIFNKYIFSI